jgi:hypothetical protein
MDHNTKDIKEPLTPNDIKGIDMVMRIMKKKFPFITGWEPTKDYRNYEGLLFIVVLINPYRLSDYLDCPIADYIEEEFILNPDRLYYGPASLFSRECLSFDQGYELKDKMEEKIKTIYREIIPEEMCKFYIGKTLGNEYKEGLSLSEFKVSLS